MVSPTRPHLAGQHPSPLGVQVLVGGAPSGELPTFLVDRTPYQEPLTVLLDRAPSTDPLHVFRDQAPSAIKPPPRSYTVAPKSESPPGMLPGVASAAPLPGIARALIPGIAGGSPLRASRAQAWEGESVSVLGM